MPSFDNPVPTCYKNILLDTTDPHKGRYRPTCHTWPELTYERNQSATMMFEKFKKAGEDLRDVGRVITGHRAPAPEVQGGAESSSRKKTGLSRHERARAMTDKQLETKYLTSCEKMVQNAAAIFSSETTAVASAKIAHAPLAVDRFEKSLEYSGKGMRQGVRSHVWRQELIERGHQPALGLMKAPESMDELKESYRPYVQAAKRAKKEIQEYKPPVYTSLPMNTRTHSILCILSRELTSLSYVDVP